MTRTPAAAPLLLACLALASPGADARAQGDPVPAETPVPSPPAETPSPAPEAALAPPALAATAPAPSPTPEARRLTVGERRRELLRLKKGLAELRARHATTKRREADLKGKLEEAELNLQIRTNERRMLELRQADAERAVALAAKERDGARTRVEGTRRDFALRAAALYRMGRLGYLRTLSSVDSGRALFKSVQALSYAAKRDATLLRAYDEALQGLATREEAFGRQERELKALVAESRQKERELAEARTTYAALYARVHRAAEAEETQVATLSEKAERLEGLLELIESRGRTLPPGAASIRRFKGALDWPAKGPVAIPFGRVSNPSFPKTFLRSSGWTVDVPPGTEVHAVFSGEVVYAQWMKGYGNLVILDHGESVFTLYGRLATGTAPRGERISLGDRVGSVAESVDEESAGLYFEIRDARSSVDPQLWLR